MTAAPKRILIVDDNADIGESLAMLLRAMDHEVYVARDGRSAIEVARSRRPEVVLVDIWLPDMSGFDVAKSLRLELGPTPRLIAMSGFNPTEGESKWMAAGFDQYVVKPIDAAFLDSWLG